jgi:hypothetical protein
MDDAKPYKLEMENRGSYLYALVSGERVTPEIGRSYWSEILRRCDELGLCKILIEKNFVETVSMQEVVQGGSQMGEFLKGRKIAVIDRFHHDDVSELGKKIARSQEVMVQIFGDTDRAEKWLIAN